MSLDGVKFSMWEPVGSEKNERKYREYTEKITLRFVLERPVYFHINSKMFLIIVINSHL